MWMRAPLCRIHQILKMDARCCWTRISRSTTWCRRQRCRSEARRSGCSSCMYSPLPRIAGWAYTYSSNENEPSSLPAAAAQSNGAHVLFQRALRATVLPWTRLFPRSSVVVLPPPTRSPMHPRSRTVQPVTPLSVPLRSMPLPPVLATRQSRTQTWSKHK